MAGDATGDDYSPLHHLLALEQCISLIFGLLERAGVATLSESADMLAMGVEPSIRAQADRIAANLRTAATVVRAKEVSGLRVIDGGRTPRHDP
jgi:hypothetical protein